MLANEVGPDGVSLRTKTGRVFVGHFPPVHKEPSSIEAAQNVFDSHDIVLGDFNASPYHLKQNGVIGYYSHRYIEVPSYLPHIPDPATARYPIRTPQFDSVYASASTCRSFRQCDAVPGRLLSLPASIQQRCDPRSLMSVYRMDSDHLPVAAVVTHNASGMSISLVTWNIADPLFWGQFYPGTADAGFPAAKEQTRMKRVLSAISAMMCVHHVIGLQEVPVGFMSELEDLVAMQNGRWVLRKTRMTCHASPNHPDTSLVVALVRSSVLSP